MIDLRKLLLIVIPWSFSLGLDAQTSTDTIQLSMKFSEKSDYSNAIAILVSYVSFHPADSNALQLIGLNYYWDKQYREADRFYGEQVEKHPEYSNLKLDYARMLFERKQFKRAGPAIKEFLLENPRNTEAREYLGYLNYWDGEYKEALSEFDLILQIYPDNKTALGMTRAIKELTRPYFFAFHEYSFDSQPMESGMQTVESGKYFSSFLNPGLKADLL
ncbi:MAG TPA: hypothetical protein DCX54_09770, partial [Flavobacteriales bacterium]|nr:hypothetical protein [Flavobacteriales bacterium]